MRNLESIINVKEKTRSFSLILLLARNLYENVKYVVRCYDYLNSLHFYFNPQLNDTHLTIVI